MENDRLLEHPGSFNRVEPNETCELGGTAAPVKTPYGQLAIVLLVLLCEPVTAFMPMPFFAQVGPSSLPLEMNAHLNCFYGSSSPSRA